MRLLPVFLLFGLLTAATAFADTITVAVPWTQVHRTPSEKGRAVDVVYGNDKYDVLESKDGWVKIRTHRKVTGWIPASAGDANAPQPAPSKAKPAASPPGAKKTGGESPASPQAPKSLQATALSNGISLRQLGYRTQARAKFRELMMDYPGSPEAYEATRQMLSYYLVGYLPPLDKGKVTEEGQAAIGQVSADVLLQEAIVLQDETKFADSARVYQFLLDHNPDDGRAFLGLLDSLQNAMVQSLKGKNTQDLDKQAATFKKYFPTVALPDGVQQRLAQVGKN